MTDKEKLLKLLQSCKANSIEAILTYFFDAYGDDITAIRMYHLIDELQNYLGRKILNLERVRYVANERATYLKSYLSGDMWLTEEAAKANIQPQIDNAQAILDACREVT